MASLRQAIPRAGFQLHSQQFQQLRLLARVRHASTTPPPKPRVLEQPDKFRPPSHPSRIRTRTPRYTGPALSDAELEAQKTKRYPHMMPPEGSVMHRFLTNRSIHLYITLTILSSLVVAIWLTDFLQTTPYLDLLPPNSMFFAHPLAFLRRWFEVYEMHVAYTSAQTAERRKQKVDDVQKRSQYRKAHGLDGGEGFGGWTAKSGDAASREGGVEEGTSPTTGSALEVVGETVGQRIDAIAGVDGNASEDTFVDFEGKTQPVQKKWFGIW